MRLLDLLDRGHSSEMLTIVFTETKRGADYLDNYLHDRGFSSTCIHGDRNQREREDAVRLFKVSIIQYDLYGGYPEMPQKAYEEGIFHVRAMHFFLEMPQNRRYSFSVR